MKAPSRLHLRTIVLAVFAVVLTWLVISQSLGAYLADVAPAAALWLSPRQPEALVNLADETLNPAKNSDTTQAGSNDQAAGQKKNIGRSTTESAGSGTAPSTAPDQVFSAFDIVDQNRSIDLAEVRSRAESAVMREPLNARALRILGQVAGTASNDVDAAKYMQEAAGLSLHENTAAAWLMLKSSQAKDDPATIHYADVLLRTNPEFSRYVMPVLARLVESPKSRGLLLTVLEGNPPWREDFLGSVSAYVTDARTPLNLFLALKKTSTPPSSGDIDGYLKILIGHKFYDLAYYTWLQFLPPEQLRNAGLLFNGNFEVAPSGLPFDWQIKSGSGVTIDIVPRPDKVGAHALMVDFEYGRVEYQSVTQLLMLAPGAYHFDGMYQGQLAGPRGLKWRIVCADESATPLGESSMISGVASARKNIEFSFTVPDAGCRAQYIRLDLDARSASEELISGSVLFDELYISRAGNPS